MSRPARRTGRRSAAVLGADVLAVLLFAAVGRRSHVEGVTPVGVLDTAWPFLVGTATGWLALRAWRDPGAVLPTGVGVWLATVLAGMLLRRATGDGTAPSFVVVAAGVLGLLLVGHRVVARAVTRLSSRTGARAGTTRTATRG